MSYCNSSNGYGGGGGNGGCYGSSMPFYTSTCSQQWGTPVPLHYITPSGYNDQRSDMGFGVTTYPDTIKEEEEEVSVIHLTKLEDLPDFTKEKILKNFYKAIAEYKHHERIKNMTSGLKWFLIFLGFAIMLNFGHILNVIQAVVTR